MSRDPATRLSVVVSWRDRAELQQTLPPLARCAARFEGEITVVNFGGDPSQLAGLIGRHACPVTTVTVAGQHYFHKARAQNVGAAHALHDLLFFCDCDILFEERELEGLVSEVSSTVGTFGTFRGVTESDKNSRRAGNVVMFGYQLMLRLANGRTLSIVDNEEDVDDGTRQAPGLLFVRREDFQGVGGYNGRLHGWGWEDQDIIARLTLAGGLRRVQRGKATHLSHDDAARMRHYPLAKDRWANRDQMFRQALENYDRGDFLGTLHADVKELQRSCSAVRMAPTDSVD